MSPSERENQGFEAMLRKYGTYALARKIERLPSYRAYKQRWPFDGESYILSIDQFEEQGIELASEDESVEAHYAVEEELAQLKSKVTPKQLRIIEHLEQGFLPREFYAEEGYKNTGGIRYHKHVIRYRHRPEDQEEEKDLTEPPSLS